MLVRTWNSWIGQLDIYLSGEFSFFTWHARLDENHGGGVFFLFNRKSFARFYCYKGIFASDYMVFEGKGGSK